MLDFVKLNLSWTFFFINYVENETVFLCVARFWELSNFFSTNLTLWCYQDLLKGIFFEVKKKFETALGVLKKEKVTIDPDDPAAVARYAEVMKTVREK